MDEKEIINLAKQKDKAAFEKLVITYKPDLEKFLYQFGIDTEGISEVVQQIFIKVYEKLDSFQTENFQAWLYKIAVGVNRDFYKKKRTVEKNSSGAYYFESDGHLFLHESISKLEEKYRLPLILFYFHEQSIEEIARILKTKPGTLNARLMTAREKLDNPEEEFFRELKDNYNLLPEFTDTNKIMNELPTKKQKKRRWQLIPLAIIIIGFFLVFMFALPEVDQSERVEKSAGEAEENENAEEPMDELELYAVEKQEAFRKELGLQSLEGFTEVEHVEQLLADRETYQFSDEELFNMIDGMYATPGQKFVELNQTEGDERNWMWQLVLGSYYNLEWSFSEYLRNLLTDFPLDGVEQTELVENQYNYNGPIEMVEFLSVLHKQGYKLEKNHDYLEVRSDYQYLVDNIDYVEGEEGIERLFTFISEKMDVHYHRHSSEKTDVPWYEFDDILLEMEDIYRSHPEIHEFIVHYTGSVQATTNYLDGYIHGGFRFGNSDVEEQLMEELSDFKENHSDSTFWQVVSRKLEMYETEGIETDPLEQTVPDAQFLFNNIESQLSYDIYHELYSWPFIDSTQLTLRNYNNTSNEGTLADLTAYETLSLYTYALDENQELHELLYIGEGDTDRVDWRTIFDWASVVLEKEMDDGTTEFSFINMHNPMFTNTVNAKVTLQHDGQGWKVIAEEKINMD